MHYLQLESERIIIDYQTIVGPDIPQKDDSDSDGGPIAASDNLYKNEFRVQKIKKLRIDEFP